MTRRSQIYHWSEKQTFPFPSILTVHCASIILVILMSDLLLLLKTRTVMFKTETLYQLHQQVTYSFETIETISDYTRKQVLMTCIDTILHSPKVSPLVIEIKKNNGFEESAVRFIHQCNQVTTPSPSHP